MFPSKSRNVWSCLPWLVLTAVNDLRPLRVSASEQRTTGLKNVLSATYDELVSIRLEARDATVETQLSDGSTSLHRVAFFSHKLFDGSADS